MSQLSDNISTPVEGQCIKCGCPDGPSSLAKYHSKQVQDLLLSNHPPTNQQSEELVEERRNLNARLQKLADKIENLEQLLSTVRREKEHIEHIVKDHDSILHPLRRTPPEILSTIFLHASEDSVWWHDQSARTQASLRDMLPAWRLAQVSHSWRHIGLAYPRLWSNVTLGPADLADKENGHRSAALMLAFHLQRARDYPLSITIKAKQIAPDHPLMQTLVPTCFRWRKLFVSAKACAYSALEPVHALLDSLEYLHLALRPGVDDDSVIKESPLATMFEFAPRLHSVAGHPAILSNINLPWLRIASYIESAYRSGFHLERIGTAPKLRVLGLRCDEEVLPSAHLTFPSVTELNVLAKHPEKLATLLKCLLLPNLTRLGLGWWKDASIDIDLLKSSLAGSSSAQHLELFPQAMYPADRCLRLLDGFPRLACLYFNAHAVATPQFARAFLSPDFIPSMTEMWIPAPEGEAATLFAQVNTTRPALMCKIRSHFAPLEPYHFYCNQYGLATYIP